jgi:hypothetical protein
VRDVCNDLSSILVWSGAAFVKDSAGQKLAYIYFENDPGRRSAAKLLSKDEARRIAGNISKLPDFLLHSRKLTGS